MDNYSYSYPGLCPHCPGLGGKSLPLITNRLEEVFSETRIQPVVSLFVRTGARGFRDEQGYRLLCKGYWTGSQRREDATERLTGARRAPVLVAAVLGS